MRILYYNWIQFDNKEKQGGGVNVYQRNLIDYFSKNTNHEIYFLSSGWKYNPLKKETYINETKNIFGDRCKSFEIINSSIIAPAFAIYMNPRKFIEDKGTYKIFDKFLAQFGPFDVIHFNNIEGISVNVLRLKEKYPNTKFVVSIHNYQPICPLNQYFQNNNKCICKDFQEGRNCPKCSEHKPDEKEYYRRARNYCYEKLSGKLKIFRLPVKLYCKLFKYRTKNYIGSLDTMLPEKYIQYRKHNIEILNKYADSILAVSERVRQIMISNGINPDKIITSYIGTKFADNELKHSTAIETKPFTIAYLGYERIDKGFFFLVDALSKLDEKIAKQINIVLGVADIHNENVFPKLDKFNKVIIHNGYSHAELKNILNNVNLGIVPVLWEDNLPQVAIEMAALGVPVLCSSFGGASELCKSELFKFKGADETDFIKKLTKFVQNPELLNEYWTNHPDLTTMQKHIEELEEIYKQGMENRQETYYIIGLPRAEQGMFAIVESVCKHVCYALKRGYTPVVDMKHYENQYFKYGREYQDNSWEYFFEQPFGVGIDEIPQNSKIIISKNCYDPTLRHTVIYDEPVSNKDVETDNYKTVKEFSKYIKIRKEIIEQAEAEKAKLFGGEKVLGVLCRGTDYLKRKTPGECRVPNPQTMINKAKKLLKTGKYTKIYLATEDVDIYNLFKLEFGAKLINKPLYMQEYASDEDRYLYDIEPNERNYHYNTGLAYLKSIYILSGCNGFIGSRTLGSRWVLIFSKGFDFFYVYQMGFYGTKLPLLQRIFSVGSEYVVNKKYKVVNLLNLKIRKA